MTYLELVKLAGEAVMATPGYVTNMSKAMQVLAHYDGVNRAIGAEKLAFLMAAYIEELTPEEATKH
jgi:hypothetical protein